ncbi:MAG: hypothetical protein QOH81_2670 [Sphingomonadales bacterium]|jgi:hypothetical protein|nr:hypothetical protein [Sphingomonadales bacterium]
MKLSITTAWNEASAFVKREAGPLFLIAFGLMALPGIILQVIAARVVGTGLQVTPGSAPDFGPLLAALPILLLLLIPVMVLSIWGHLTINVLALRRETVIGSAFGHAARRILPLLGAWLLLMVILAIPVLLILGLGVSVLGASRVGLAALLFLILWLAAVFAAIRLMLMTPVAAAEPVGPVDIIRRSWRLTSGHFWKLLGFLLLILIVFFVLVLVVGSVAGILVTLLAGRPDPGSLSSLIIQLITGVLQAVFLTYFVVVIARIYAQLSGDISSVAEVFE